MNQSVFALQARLQSGFTLHQQGRLGEAEAVYREILRIDKRNADALHLLGVIYYQTGRHEEAVESISRAIKLSPGAAMAYYNRGNALQALNRFEDAVANFSKAISLNPHYAEAYNNRGTALNELGRFADAVASCDKAIELQAAFAEAHNNRGISLMRLGRPEESLASYDKALSLNPRYPEAWNNRGLPLRNLGRFDDALASYAKALEIRPRYAEAWNNRGNTLGDLQRFDEALASYGKALECQPAYAEAWNNRGNALHSLKRRAEAIASYAKAIEFKPVYAEAWNNRGNAFLHPRDIDQAVNDYDKAIALRPDFVEAYANRGKALYSLKRFSEALENLDKATALNPDHAGAHFTKAQIRLLLADFAAGWTAYEWRKKTESPAGHRRYPKPPLTSLADAGRKTILVHWEQGLGDTLQFCRYVTLLAERGAKILFAPQPALMTLMGSLNPGITLVDADDPSLAFDAHVPLMSLPLLFDTRLETIPAAPAYLFADAELIETWNEKLGRDGLRIGICWQGNPNHKDDAFRSFPLALFTPLADIPKVRLISLQSGYGKEQLDDLPAGTVETLDETAAPFAETAAVMKNLDLVITADTAVAHLAGALGVQTWVALHHAPDWRWLLDGADNPWYPGMRLFRQQANDDWQSVFEDIRTALLEWTAKS
jgi:tetratricopeptide (TPR) repeat protein